MNRLIHSKKATPLLLAKAQILFLITLLCAAIAGVQSVHAATIFVTNTMDSGPGSLRQALADATDLDTIDFSVSGTIFLTTGQLVVDDSVTISGPGANMLAVDGNAASTVFYINPGKTVTISDLMITNGNAGNGGNSVGGGIYNDHATLMVSNCTVSGNFAVFGGGIYNDGTFGSTSLWISNSTLSGNSAHYGGGIYNDGSASLSNSTVSGNSTDGRGGGMYLIDSGGSATVTLNDSAVTGNSRLAFFGTAGGGISVIFDHNSTLEIKNSTVSGNTAADGGGIFTDGSDGTVDLNGGSKVTKNTTSDGGGGGIFNRITLNLNDSSNVNWNTAAQGGGIYAQRGTVNVNDSGNVNKNTASEQGGGIFNRSVGPVNLNNSSAVNHNTAAQGGGIYDDSGTLNQNGGSVLHNTPDDIAP